MSSGSLSTGEIVGLSVGGVLAILSIIGIIMTCYSLCCKSNKQGKVQQAPPPRPPPEPYGQQPYNGYYGQQQQQGYYGQPPSGPPQQQSWRPQQVTNPQQPVYYQ